jgi:cardiolipin synthase
MLATIYVVFQLLGLIAAVHAVMTVRTAQGALAWALALVGMPVISLPA